MYSTRRGRIRGVLYSPHISRRERLIPKRKIKKTLPYWFEKQDTAQVSIASVKVHLSTYQEDNPDAI